VILDRNGRQAQIKSPIQAVAGFTYFLSWSPNSRYLAFSVLREEDPLGTETLLVYDSESQKITFKCSLNIDMDRFSESIYYWSPDSRYLAYSMAITQPINIIDTQTGRIEVLPVIGMPFGWSDKFSIKKEK
jgi:Tol biopolymer transport system component